MLRRFPRLAPLLLQLSMRALVKKEYVAVSYKVFNIGAANRVPAYSGEIAIPTDGRHIEAVETIFEVADAQRRSRRIYQSSPIALRFVKASPAYLSMMNGSETMMIELIELHGSKGAVELIGAYEEALTPLGGRPHWGQINALSGRRQRSRRCTRATRTGSACTADERDRRVRQPVLRARRHRAGSPHAVAQAAVSSAAAPCDRTPPSRPWWYVFG